MENLTIEDVRGILKTYMLENNYGLLQITASMSMSKDNIVLSVTYDEDSDEHLNGYNND
ncbi:hypothetical protein Harreka1_50 [Olleya phage Harreka_1]|uniref:Uncharacterized protein n=1 Tax=Olleya phage Harreka_1 TaxID=2745673 RepID=A0A8E4ZCJ1_9CAUD|nr:hypothetical protein M1M26_gp50 [Olleya phage Harreka_1]QQV90457.1 hypothetical protein Harreka1_50 [Olleya phage Harreka_1]